MITYTQWIAGTDEIEVDGFVPGLVEIGGTCTALATPPSGAPTRTASAPAVADAATTTCGAVVVSVAGAERGIWTVTLAYASDRSGGVSPEQGVQVGP